MSDFLWKNEADLQAALMGYFAEPYEYLIDDDEPMWMPRAKPPYLLTGMPDVVCDGDGRTLVVECKFNLRTTTAMLGALAQCAGYVTALKRLEENEDVSGVVVIDTNTALKVAKAGREIRDVARALGVEIRIAAQMGRALDYFDTIEFFIDWTEAERDVEFPADEFVGAA